jgi:hypothetical protein
LWAPFPFIPIATIRRDQAALRAAVRARNAQASQISHALSPNETLAFTPIAAASGQQAERAVKNLRRCRLIPLAPSKTRV